MSQKFKVFVSCDEANHVCDKTQYKDASLWEKIKLNIHLIYCAACRKYTKNNAKLTKLVTDPKVDCLEPKEKEVMKTNLEKEIVNH